MKLRLINFLWLMMFLLSSTVNAQWRLDGDDRLRNFRLDDQLHASASAQPTVASLEELRSKLPRGYQIYIVDLRQESHGFANNTPVSWYVQYNQGNVGKTAAEVEQDEMDRLRAIVGTRQTFEPMGNSDKKLFKPLKFKVKSVESERDIVERAGFHYVRFTDADMSAPDPKLIADFVEFVKELPSDAWLHFHCQAGMGRGTLFMVLYDIIKNPDKPLDEIVQRQFDLGGANLFAENNGDDWYAQRHRERAAMIREFYRRAQSEKTSGVRD